MDKRHARIVGNAGEITVGALKRVDERLVDLDTGYTGIAGLDCRQHIAPAANADDADRTVPNPVRHQVTSYRPN